MKKVNTVIAILFSLSVSAQNYADSSILLTLTQRGAVYVGFFIKNNPSGRIWENRTAPAFLKDYVQEGAKLDSVFTVSVKAYWISGLIELLLASPNEVTQADRSSIINNSPAVPGYTGLANQIVALANGSSKYKQVAIWIRDYYLDRVAAFGSLRTENIQSVVNWSKN